jgi:molybdopterin-guanine dinucleotide biosynthesis protein A
MEPTVRANANRVAGVIFAGGQSRRMGGGDKALLSVGERSILQRVVARLGAQTSWLMLNANGDAGRWQRRVPGGDEA